MRGLLPRPVPWRSRSFWQPVGYGLTALWMIGILSITQEDVRHPLFSLIFVVPLAGWIIGIVVARVIARYWPPQPTGPSTATRRPAPRDQP